MKTLKYRSIVGTLGVAMLSVFLFTSCEKESDGIPKKPDRLSKFKSLTFTGDKSVTGSGAGTGTFTGNNNNVSFSSPGGPETNYNTNLEEGQEFTDPTATGNSFDIAAGFTAGGGTVSLDGKSYDIDFGFCASSDFFGFTSDINGTTSSEELEVFIGVSGDFDPSNFEEEDSLSNPLNLFLFVFSYNGGSQIGDFTEFNNGGGVDNSAFVVAVEFDDDADDLDDVAMYFSTSGSVDFNGANVTLSNIRMAEVFEDIVNGNELGSERVGLQAFLECGGIVFDTESEPN